MILENKVALIFGAGGAIGSEVSRTFAKEGAWVFLSGRHVTPIESLAKKLRSEGFRAEAGEVDASRENDVQTYVDDVAKKTGKIDAVFNAIGLDPKHTGELCMPSTNVTSEQFLEYTNNVVLSQFLTARAAARHMLRQKSGAVIFLTATPGKGVAPFMAGHSAGHAALEGLIRSLALEWGTRGVRVVGIRSGGNPESRRIQEVLTAMSKIVGAPVDGFIKAAHEKPLLKRMSTLSETANVVAFLASDYASSLTATIINSSCGEVMD